ncbi:MAG: hypothetical protein ACO1N5_12080 [Noviherbaspirillum sp.]
MSSFALSPTSESVGVRAYVANVAQAARSLVAALTSYSRKPSANRTTAAQRRRAKSIFQLYQMAGQFDSISPSMASELRHIAARQD